MQYFAKEQWWVKLIALSICKLPASAVAIAAAALAVSKLIVVLNQVI